MAISYVNQVVTVESNWVDTTVDMTVPAAGVAVGSTLMLVCVQNVLAATITVTDQKGNTWTVDKTQATSGNNTRVSIVRGDISVALVSGDWIRITASQVTGLIAFVHQFIGLASTDAFDKGASQESPYNTNPTTSGLTATTTVNDELLVGAFGIEGTGTRWTISNAFTELNDADASTISRSIVVGYKIVSATGTYEFSAAQAITTQALGIICTYKIGSALDQVLPDADVVTTGWSTAPLFSKVNDDSDATVISATAS